MYSCVYILYISEDMNRQINLQEQALYPSHQVLNLQPQQSQYNPQYNQTYQPSNYFPSYQSPQNLQSMKPHPQQQPHQYKTISKNETHSTIKLKSKKHKRDKLVKNRTSLNSKYQNIAYRLGMRSQVIPTKTYEEFQDMLNKNRERTLNRHIVELQCCFASSTGCEWRKEINKEGTVEKEYMNHINDKHSNELIMGYILHDQLCDLHFVFDETTMKQTQMSWEERLKKLEKRLYNEVSKTTNLNDWGHYSNFMEEIEKLYERVDLIVNMQPENFQRPKFEKNVKAKLQELINVADLSGSSENLSQTHESGSNVLTLIVCRIIKLLKIWNERRWSSFTTSL